MTMPLSNHLASQSADRATFENFYDGLAPWDIGGPQPSFVAIADQVKSPVLDAGCGTGEHALYFAARGHRVIGIDFVDVAIRRARRKAAARNQSVEFLLKDATTLSDWSERFACVIDCGLFHVFSDEERLEFANNLGAVLMPGGRYFMLCISERETREGPRRITQAEIRDTFRTGWTINNIQEARFETLIHEGGAWAWLASISKKASR